MKGEIYGLDHSPSLQTILLKPKTPIKIFYLTGQDIVTAVEGTVLRRIVYYDYGEKCTEKL
jgi:all-trans-retinol 13,14-reductase